LKEILDTAFSGDKPANELKQNLCSRDVMELIENLPVPQGKHPSRGIQVKGAVDAAVLD
jgi:hypothetical protein